MDKNREEFFRKQSELHSIVNSNTSTRTPMRIIYVICFLIAGFLGFLLMAGNTDEFERLKPRLIFFFLATLIPGILCAIKSANCSSKIDDANRELDSLRKEIESYNAKAGKVSEEFKDKLGIHTVNASEIVYGKKDNYMSIAIMKNNLYFFGHSIDGDISEYANGKYLESNKTDIKSFIDKIQLFASDLDGIEYFYKEGDVQYTTSISGGEIKGGGSSIGGAIVGGMIAGGTGAIIGSRQKIESEGIKTVENKHDSRISVICYKDGDSMVTRKFHGFHVYDFFLKHVPEKDLLYIQAHNKTSDTDAKSTNMDIEERLAKLKNLYDKKLIEADEYEKKRNEILDSI